MQYAIILFLFLCSCQKPFPHTPVVNINPDFQKYVDEFVSESINYGHPVQITDLIMLYTYELDGTTLGVCRDYYGNNTPIILINQNTWPYKTDEYRRAIIFHELGHCVLNREEHVLTGSFRNGFCTATSIMWPYIINQTNMYVVNWNDYMVELFSGVSTAPTCYFNNYWGGI